MGITQQIGASSIIKPGVIDNTAARPASPFEGQVIFQKDTDQLLVWNGTAWVMAIDTDTPPGLQLIAGATFSNVTSIDVTGFTSEFEWYEVYFQGIRHTSGSTAVLGVLYDGATARNSAYYGGNGYTQFDGTSGNQYTMNNAGDFYATGLENRYKGNFTMRVFYKAGEQFTYNYQAFEALNFRSVHGAGFRNATDSWDRIRFSGVSGATITGSWALYGRRK
jgi:hypothetical protein